MQHTGHTTIGLRLTLVLTAIFCAAALAQSGVRDSASGDFESSLKRGFDLHQQARFAEAVPILEHARRLQPSDYFANLLLGIDLLRAGKAASAIPRLELAARANPKEEIPTEYLGEANAALGRYAEAAQAYQQAIERGHNSEESLEAWAGFSLERFREIGLRLRASESGTAIVRNLQDAAARPASSLTCDSSIPLLERALTPRPSTSHSIPRVADHTAFKLSICYALEAGRAAERLETAGRDTASISRLRGDILLRLKGDPTGAQTEYRSALALRPGDPALLERLADAQFTAGDSESARQSAEAALAIDPHRRAALQTLATLAVSTRDYQEALPLLRQLAVESPSDQTARVELGRALAQTGNAAEAVSFLQPALSAGYPDEKGSLHALLARVLRELGRVADAAKASAEARRLSDTFQARDKSVPEPAANPGQRHVDQ